MRTPGWWLLGSVTAYDIDTTTLAQFVPGARSALEQALVARFGLHDGMEAAAEAVAYGCEHWNRVQAMGNPVGYLYRVGESSAKRRGVRRRLREGVLVAEPSTTDSPVDIDLQRALARLTAPQRVAIVLVHAHGHTYADAARIMDMPVTSVTNHVNRGLARLRHLMED